MVRYDLNCDLGEGEPFSRTQSLMRLITSANVACGGHAGNVVSMERCIRWAKQYRVHLGAHPGIPSEFGRADVGLNPSQVETWVLQQVGALQRLAAEQKVRLHHIKLHGALYHAVEQDARLASAYLNAVQRWFPNTIIYARAGGRVSRLGGSRGIPVWQEGFLDRAYLEDGRLVPRSEPHALLLSSEEVKNRLRDLQEGLGIRTISGKRLYLEPKTLCIHGDTPQALALVRSAYGLLSCSSGSYKTTTSR